jgi:hypothetical protein
MLRKSATALIATLALTLSAAYLAPALTSQAAPLDPNKNCMLNETYGPVASSSRPHIYYYSTWVIDCGRPGNTPCEVCVQVVLSYRDNPGFYHTVATVTGTVGAACTQFANGRVPGTLGDYTIPADNAATEWVLEVYTYDGACPPAGIAYLWNSYAFSVP